MSRVRTILFATFVIALVWKVAFGGSSDVEYEYEPEQ